MTTALHGSTTGLVFLGAYEQILEKEYGKERATALTEMVMQSVAQAHAKMIKEESGLQEFDLVFLHAIIPGLLYENMGIEFSAVEQTANTIVYNVGRCPVYESSVLLGFEPTAIESRCRATGLKYLEAVLKELNPKASVELDSFRSSPSEPCQESFVISQ